MKKIPLLFLLMFVTLSAGCEEPVPAKPVPEKIALWGDFPHQKPSCVKGIHLTSWYVGSEKARAKYEPLLSETELNTVVIDIKEIEGEVYIPGVQLEGHSLYVNAMPRIKEYLTFLKNRGVYTIARIVVFKDSGLPKIKPEWAIQSSSPLPKALEKGFLKNVWVDHKGLAWADPYNPHVWDYNIMIAEKAADMGFQEIQFDYIRFPSDGNMKLCVYSKPHSSATAVKALATFLERAKQRLKPKGVEISIDVFGLTGSLSDDMGIGQHFSSLLDSIDVISPMMYPSHYAKGEYGLAEPNKSPYETLNRGLRDAKKKLHGKPVQLRPWIQDFSMGGVTYTPDMVRAQIEAANDLGIDEWLLWNAACRYTKNAMLPFYKKSKPTEKPHQEEPVVENEKEPVKEVEKEPIKEIEKTTETDKAKEKQKRKDLKKAKKLEKQNKKKEKKEKN